MNHLSLSKNYWNIHLQPGDLVIDCTCGNGHDTLFLSQLLLPHPKSVIIGFDIQKKAIQNTETLLQKHFSEDQLQRVFIHQRSHAEINDIDLPSAPSLIVYNLGYLPQGDKTLTTETQTTLNSIKKAMGLLAEHGALSITCYPGHLEGAKEEVALLKFVETLPSHLWLVCYHKWVNRLRAPTFIWIKRLKADEV